MKEKVAEFFVLLQGFRKFIVALLILLVSIVFRIKGLLSGVEFVDLSKAITLGFFGTNSMEGLFSVVKEHLQARRDAGNVAVPPPTDKEEDEEVEIQPVEATK